MNRATREYVLDLAERAAWTFVQAFFGVLAAAQIPHSLSEARSLAVAGLAAGVAAVISLAKSIIAGVRLGTASTSRTVAAARTAEPTGAHADTGLSIVADVEAALTGAEAAYPMRDAA